MKKMRKKVGKEGGSIVIQVTGEFTFYIRKGRIGKGRGTRGLCA